MRRGNMGLDPPDTVRREPIADCPCRVGGDAAPLVLDADEPGDVGEVA